MKMEMQGRHEGLEEMRDEETGYEGGDGRIGVAE